MVLVVMLMLSLAGAALVNLSTADGVETGKRISNAHAFWAAEAGLESIRTIAHKNREPFENLGLYGNGVFTGSTLHGTYIVDVLPDPDWSNPGNAIKRYRLRATGRSLGGMTKVVEVHAEIQTFASYMHSSHWERMSSGSRIYFAYGDVLDGPVYTNDRLNIYGGGSNRPRLLDETHSADNQVNYQGGAGDATFEGGLILNAPPLDFIASTGTDHVAFVEDRARRGGLVLDGEWRIRFDEDGSYSARRLDRIGNRSGQLSDFNGAIYVSQSAHVYGTVDGRVTVAAEDTIEIEDDLMYESASTVRPHHAGFDVNAVNDAVGLIARDEIIVEGSDTINIHAGILVTEGNNGFNARNKYTNLGQPYIYLFGSLGQYRRGVIGRVSGAGFRKYYKYDRRFMEHPPAHFPYSTYEISQWQVRNG